MQTFEKDYAVMLDSILFAGEERQTRNGLTKSLFGRTLHVNMTNGYFPLIQGRKMYYKGVLGEFAAMGSGPKRLEDFEQWGCNYWKKWAKPDGSINVDYGNAWIAYGQLDRLRHALAHNPTDRRMLINGWRADKLEELDLPCCHYSYQFYVTRGKYLDMIWNQRSVDMMIGLPADIILAAAWVAVLANEVGLKPGNINMNLGDCHIYAEHFEQAKEYIGRVKHTTLEPTTFQLNTPSGMPMTMMTPDWFEMTNYQHLQPMKLELKA